MIDVGTNGEIVLTGKGMAMACSTAAGPAFEGASIFKGMRAAEGAIEKVRIDSDVHIKVIGNTAPRRDLRFRNHRHGGTAHRQRGD